MNTDVTVKTHHSLPSITEEQFRQEGAKVLGDADQGVQTALVGKNGRITSVIGLNGMRYLPDPDPDPFDELLQLALRASQGQK